MNKMLLNGQWSVRFHHPVTGEDHCIPAMVPGNIELDLDRAGLLGDALPPDVEFAEHWVSLTDWEFEREFEYEGLPSGASQAMLRFEGIDTVAEVFLNGEKILSCENMHLTYQKDVTSLLKCGSNHLLVRIFAPEIAARKYRHPAFSFSSHPSALYLRKAKHCWGWDNAPMRLTAGIWRNVSLEFLAPTRFESAYVATDWIDFENDKAFLNCDYWFITPDKDLTKYALRVKMIRNGNTEFNKTFVVRHTEGTVTAGQLELNHPALWNPVGFGDPNLYDFVLILEKDGVPVAEHKERIGIRTVWLERSEIVDPDGKGQFQFYCNGQKIFMRGTNWKPLSPYHSQTPERLQRGLELIRECNCNMVRVWGGGVYEDHEFFDFCDENGIFVWQDFMLACEVSPQDETFRKIMAEEAKFVIEKYRNHPSLAVWNGDNENDMFWGNHGGRAVPSSSNEISRVVLRDAVRNSDPWRCYLQTSPLYSDQAVNRFKQRSIWNYYLFAPEQHMYSGYDLPEGGFRQYVKESMAYFSSEIAPCGISAMSETPEFVERELHRIKRLWNVDPATVECSGDSTHQTDYFTVNWCASSKFRTRLMFGREFTPENPDELCKAINFYVADAHKAGVEIFRLQRFRRTGMLWWSLLDMWPMAYNYSVVDSNFRKKFPFEALRLAQQPLLLTAKDPEQNEMPELYAINDTAFEQKGSWKAVDSDGKEICSGTFQAEPNGMAKIGSLPLAVKQYCILQWDCGKFSGKNYYINPGEPYDFETCCKLMERVRDLR